MKTWNASNEILSFSFNKLNEHLIVQVRQEARELQSKYCETSPGPEEASRGVRLSKRISVPENFSYFPGPQQPPVSLQTQLAQHRLAQKRASLCKQREREPRESGRGRELRPLRPGQVWPRAALGTPHTSDCLFQVRSCPLIGQY